MNTSQKTENLSDDMKEVGLETKVRNCMTDGQNVGQAKMEM